MKYFTQNFTDPFRDKTKIAKLIDAITRYAQKLSAPLHIMEVCGGHTHTIMKYGFLQMLPKNIVFIHGPGCPVCIMPRSRIDHAYTLSMQKDVILLCLGDLMKVPGSLGSLSEARSLGADIRFIYSPLEALKIAQENPQKSIIFFAIGFETTTPMSAALLERTKNEKVNNLLFHINHVTIIEPLNALLSSQENLIDALLAPSHVSVITGSQIYEPLQKQYNIPIVIAGFEPTDILESIFMILQQHINKKPQLQNQYLRCVHPDGNIKAQKMIQQYFEKRDFEWRGLGIIPLSAWKIKDTYSLFDAEVIFADCLKDIHSKDDKNCICGDILRGVKKPKQCALFGTLCTPRNPIGSCMVSSEGACAAYYKYAL